MPKKDEHRSKADHNDAFAAATGTPYWDWSITGMFYAATHFIEAYLATIGIHFTNHTLRESYVGRDVKLRPIYKDFRELRSESEDARYMEEVPPTKFKEADAKRLRGNLERIKARVLPLI